MTLDELVQQVLGVVGRPDKYTDAVIAVNAAVAKFSVLGNFACDLVEDNVAPTYADSDTYVFTVDISAAPFTRFRKFKYIKPRGWTRYLTMVEPDRMFTADFKEKINTWYRAGSQIVGKAQARLTTLDFGYYQRPAYMTAADAEDYWMMTDPLGIVAITHDAVGDIFEIIGDVTEANKYRSKAMTNFLVLRDDQMLGSAAS